MRYDDQDRQSSNVEDRRGQRGGFGMPGGRGIQIPIGGRGGLSLTSLLIIGALMLLFGINPLEVLMGPQGGGSRQISFPEMPELPRAEAPSRPSSTGQNIPGLPGGTGGAGTAEADPMGTFMKRVLADTEDVWTRVFQSFGKTYDKPNLVMFTGGTRTACGVGQTQMGPFYCPLDQKIYIDLAFYEELKRRFNAPGDFAQAYVIAHEVGHHVQTLLGIADKVQDMKAKSMRRGDEVGANQIQVRMELQADCLAGVWANLNHQLNQRLEPGDIEEGLRAANAIGDDMIQKKTQGYVVPDAFTHGSAEQRMRWFTTGYKSGQMQSCDTFGTDSL